MITHKRGSKQNSELKGEIGNHQVAMENSLLLHQQMTEQLEKSAVSRTLVSKDTEDVNGTILT